MSLHQEMIALRNIFNLSLGLAKFHGNCLVKVHVSDCKGTALYHHAPNLHFQTACPPCNWGNNLTNAACMDLGVNGSLGSDLLTKYIFG